MASMLSHKSIVEICTFIPSNEHARLPNKEWTFTARHCALPGSWLPRDLPPGYFSSDGFRIAVGKQSLAESLDIVFSPGEPLMLWKEVPKGLVEGILERYRTACKQPVAMRRVTLTAVDIADVWVNAYYTSFPCRHCSSHEKALTTRSILVFHLTPPEANQCLNLKYRKWTKRVEVVSCRADCAGSGMHSRQSLRARSTLCLADLRHEAYRYLPRADLDTCLLVNSLWSTEVKELSDRLALRELTRLEIISCFEERFCLSFIVSTDEVDLGPDRSFMLPRDAAVDSAVAVNHLRNCTAPAEGFGIDFGGRKIDDGVAMWISGLLRSAENFRFARLDMSPEWADNADVIDFMMLTRDALLSSTKVNGLRYLWLQIHYSALEGLSTKRFLQWPYMQNLEHIRLEMQLFTPEPPGEPTWIRDLFQLPNCKSVLVEYIVEQRSADCSGRIFAVLRETMKMFENAAGVSGFAKDFQFVLRQPQLTWEHEEPTPTHSNVPGPYPDGPYNVYDTENKATGVPLSVFVNTKENCQGIDEEAMERWCFLREERRFLFRKEPYNLPFVKPSLKCRLE